MSIRERPIIFSAPMVRALLSGAKTQTRRVAKLNAAGRLAYRGKQWHPEDSNAVLACPYGAIGDRLWVRETFKPIASGAIRDGEGDIRYGFAYEADGATSWSKQTTLIIDLTEKADCQPMQFKDRPWKPSIHMPRRASRILLEITEVRVQRLQDISETDAIAEGARKHDVPMGMPFAHSRWSMESPKTTDECLGSARFAFANYFCKIHGKEYRGVHDSTPWELNPFVWVISFKRVAP